eukprot:gnl/TRDRNA2_/TRDRNA2_156080_c0_seq1.p3 gnl/TRDRNA2_/TRDRNA2_156080_c0~~gnl/TRDRNA2_/TRDRNA2_156080_c0_seq1.p3  ORF type:complete len:125 (+),score=6.68 gnl/TRDRNA2_/TRDRNA2_156080_c0_seq1:137-511(+)
MSRRRLLPTLGYTSTSTHERPTECRMGGAAEWVELWIGRMVSAAECAKMAACVASSRWLDNSLVRLIPVVKEGDCVRRSSSAPSLELKHTASKEPRMGILETRPPCTQLDASRQRSLRIELRHK